MTTFAATKVLASLPDPLDANTVYFVRVGTGFDLYVTDDTGAIAYKANVPPVGLTLQAAQTAAYTFAIGDANTCTPFVLSAAVDATIPAHASVAFPTGTLLYVLQAGDAAVTLAGDTGVTVHTSNGAATTALGDVRCALCIDTDEWTVL